MNPDGEVEGEVTRTEVVRYLQGALGHVVGSSLLILLGGLLWLAGHSGFAYTSIIAAFFLSVNGVSIWGWDRLRAYFSARTTQQADPERELTASPLSDESRVEMQAGAVMIGSFVGLLVLGRFAVQFLDLRFVVYVCVGALVLGNVAALARTLDE